MPIRLIILGDIVGTPGRQAVAQAVPILRQRHEPDLILANAENAANGAGLTPELYQKLSRAGVDAFTLGDHVYKKQQIAHTLESEPNIIRPANLPAGAAGSRWMKLPIPGKRDVYVVTVLGRLFMNHLPADDPFACVEAVMSELPEPSPILVLEVHAEATSEKAAMGWRFNGKAAVVFGTHTHVPTADARILPAGVPGSADGVPGTAYITDLGMCGSVDSVLGRRVDRVLKHMTTAMPAPFDVADGDPRVSGVVVDIDEPSGRATRIERIEYAADVSKPPFTAT